VPTESWPFRICKISSKSAVDTEKMQRRCHDQGKNIPCQLPSPAPCRTASQCCASSHRRWSAGRGCIAAATHHSAIYSVLEVHTHSATNWLRRGATAVETSTARAVEKKGARKPAVAQEADFLERRAFPEAPPAPRPGRTGTAP